MGSAAALAGNPSPKALMGGRGRDMLPGVWQAQGAVWTLAAGWHRAQLHTRSLMTPPPPFGLSLRGQWPAVTAWPLTEVKREGLPTGVSFSLYQKPPQLSVRRQATTAAPSPRGQHAQGLRSASTGTGDTCVCCARSSAANSRGLSQAQIQVRGHHPERAQARQRRHQ